MSQDEMDLVYRVLDGELIDSDGRHCGRVDDIEIDGGPGRPAYLAMLLSGHGTWHRRLPRPFRRVGAKVFGTGTVGRDVIQVPWDQVSEVDVAVHLKQKAREYGLGRGDDVVGELVGKVPGA
jgi:sporulation protein YlmC with PRC-barrel domain